MRLPTEEKPHGRYKEARIPNTELGCNTLTCPGMAASCKAVRGNLEGESQLQAQPGHLPCRASRGIIHHLQGHITALVLKLPNLVLKGKKYPISSGILSLSTCCRPGATGSAQWALIFQGHVTTKCKGMTLAPVQSSTPRVPALHLHQEDAHLGARISFTSLLAPS